jgi:3-deoxy-D-manno-octulosonate 8-phosphate phosphatase (KDO 8-P phosphatase)
MVTHPAVSVRHLPTVDAMARARRVRLLATDCDGVLTDGAVYCSAGGEELLRFSRRDGMAFELLREAGVDAAIITRERSPIVERRAQKLGVPVYAGVRDKRAVLAQLLMERRLDTSEVAYMGDDINDLAVLREVAAAGLAGAPRDAEPAISELVHFVSARVGGQGAFREFVELILDLREPRGLRLLEERRTPT